VTVPLSSRICRNPSSISKPGTASRHRSVVDPERPPSARAWLARRTWLLESRSHYSVAAQAALTLRSSPSTDNTQFARQCSAMRTT